MPGTVVTRLREEESNDILVVAPIVVGIGTGVCGENNERCVANVRLLRGALRRYAGELVCVVGRVVLAVLVLVLVLVVRVVCWSVSTGEMGIPGLLGCPVLLV